MKPWRFIYVAAALLLAVYLLCGKQRPVDAVLQAQEIPAPPVNWKADLHGTLPNELSQLPRMDNAIDSFLNFWGLHGASLAIVRNDSLLYARGYGWADASTRMNADVRLRLASVSKLLTAIGIMRLQEQGKVFLDTPVFGPFGVLKRYDKYIKDDNFYAITVEHLLRHQGGFSTRGGDVMFNTQRFMQLNGLSEPPTTEYLVRKELGRRLAFEPGADQEYSNFGYLLLSLIIEEVTGMTYETYMQQEVFGPAGCRHFALGGDYLKDRLPGETRYYMHPDAEPGPSFDGKFASVDKCYGGNFISGLYGAGDLPLETASAALKETAFRACFWWTLIPVAILFVGGFFLPESPVWLRRRVEIAVDDVPVASAASRGDTLLQRKYVIPFLLALAVLTLNKTMGMSSITSYSVVIFQKAGFVGSLGNVGDFAIKATNLLMTLVAAALVDRKGRTWLLKVGTAGMTIGLAAIGCVFLAVERFGVQATTATGAVTLGAFFVMQAFYALGPGVCVWLVLSELMPSRIRANGMSIALFANQLTAWGLASTFLPWVNAWGWYSMFFFFAANGAVYFVVSCLIPETRGKSLDELEHLFDRR